LTREVLPLYPMRGEAPMFVLLCHCRVTEVSVTFRAIGWPGGLGKVEGSGARWKITFGFLGAENRAGEKK
ncbi:hypothetical protein AVEN_105918-1, partial [Araneus ventricosus]